MVEQLLCKYKPVVCSFLFNTGPHSKVELFGPLRKWVRIACQNELYMAFGIQRSLLDSVHILGVRMGQRQQTVLHAGRDLTDVDNF